MNNNYAVILAAGIGSRLYPLTQEFPKSLVKVNGRAILDYQISGYLKSGIKEENIYIVTGYKHEMIASYLKDHYQNVKEIYSPDYLTTNNMYSLYLALKKISEIGFNQVQSLFINNADCLYDEKLMNEFVFSDYQNAIACEVGVYIDESMKVVIRPDGSLDNIAKTILQAEAYGVSVDLYKYSSQTASHLFEIVKDFIEIKKDLKQWTEVAFPELFKTDKVYPFDIKHKKWVEVDNNDDLSQADKLFSDFNLAKKKALICDMDGTIYLGSEPIQNAIEFIRNNNQLDYYFLTNNTSETQENYVVKLDSCDIEIKEDSSCLTEINSIPDIGNYIKLFELTSKITPNFVLRKPSVNTVKEILKKYKVEELAIIGDRLDTDKKLADNLKCDFVCVLSGETTRLDVQNYTGSYPSIVVRNLGDIK